MTEFWHTVGDWDPLGGSDCKESAYNQEAPGSIPGSERSPGEGNGNPLQYSWRIPWTEEPAGYRPYSPWVAKSPTGLSD